jgi:hypothetical protein
VTVINSDNGFYIVWGAEAIGQVIGRSARATFHMLENGTLPGRKVGGRWVASRKALLTALVGERDRTRAAS